MKKVLFFCAAVAVLTFSSCTSKDISLENGNPHVEFYKGDFTLSQQFTAEATSTKIINIDWSRLFNQETGKVVGGPGSKFTLPVIGNLLSDRTANYALYKLLQENPGYDVIFYPQYETNTVRPIGIGALYKTTTVKVTARLGKMK